MENVLEVPEPNPKDRKSKHKSYFKLVYFQQMNQ